MPCLHIYHIWTCQNVCYTVTEAELSRAKNSTISSVLQNLESRVTAESTSTSLSFLVLTNLAPSFFILLYSLYLTWFAIFAEKSCRRHWEANPGWQFRVKMILPLFLTKPAYLVWRIKETFFSFLRPCYNRKVSRHFLEHISEVTLDDITSVAQKMLSSCPTMASWGDGLHSTLNISHLGSSTMWF
jgi:hypothetical protein